MSDFNFLKGAADRAQLMNEKGFRVSMEVIESGIYVKVSVENGKPISKLVPWHELRGQEADGTPIFSRREDGTPFAGVVKNPLILALEEIGPKAMDAADKESAA